MTNINDLFKYKEIQGVIKDQESENTIQVFLFFENPEWKIPELASVSKGFSYSYDYAVDDNPQGGNVFTLRYENGTNVGKVMEHVFNCVEYNYDLEKRNEMFSQFIQSAQNKFINGDINELERIVSIFNEPKKEKPTPPPSQEIEEDEVPESPEDRVTKEGEEPKPPIKKNNHRLPR